MPEKVMLLLVGGRSAIATIMGALQFINEVDRVKFLICEHKDNRYLTFQQNIIRLLRDRKPNLLCDAMQDIKTVDGNDFDKVTTAVSQLCPENIDLHYVNLTSVPQSMSFAVYNYLRQNHPQALPFSVYTNSSQLIPLVPGKKTQNLTRKMTVDDYMTACNTAVFQYKFDIDNLSCTQEQADSLVDAFVADIAQTDKFLANIRRGENIKTPKTIHLKKASLSKNIDHNELALFMRRLHELQLISRFTEEETQFSYRFETKHDYAFLYGDWLEYYVYREAQKAGFDFVKMSVELRDFKGEIDVFCVHNANALICECKTGSYSTNDLTRLESKAIKLGGNYCVRLFITSTPVAKDSDEFQKFCNQAANRRIVVITGEDLPEIGERLKQQMDNPTYPRN